MTNQLQLFDFGELNMPKPAPTTDKAQPNYVRCHEEKGDLYMCAIDVVMWAKGEDYETARISWRNAKTAMEQDDSQLVQNLYQLKTRAPDGKMRETDFLNVDQFFGLALALPGKKTQKFKDAAAYLMAREFERVIERKKQTAWYITHGKTDAWVEARMEAKDSHKALRELLYNTHVYGKPNYAGIFSIQNQGIFEMSKARIALELGLTKAQTHEWREYLGEFAQLAISDANRIADRKMKKEKRLLTDEEQIEVVLYAARMAGSKLREYSAFLNIDPLTGETLDDDGKRIEKPRQTKLLERGNE